MLPTHLCTKYVRCSDSLLKILSVIFIANTLQRLLVQHMSINQLRQIDLNLPATGPKMLLQLFWRLLAGGKEVEQPN